jgi:hypothetical protein
MAQAHPIAVAIKQHAGGADISSPSSSVRSTQTVHPAAAGERCSKRILIHVNSHLDQRIRRINPHSLD